MSPDARGGRDTFAYSGAFGQDLVYGFRQGEDVLEVAARPGELAIGLDPVGNTVVSVAGAVSQGTVTLIGFGGTLTPSDILLVA